MLELDHVIQFVPSPDVDLTGLVPDPLPVAIDGIADVRLAHGEPRLELDSGEFAIAYAPRGLLAGWAARSPGA